MLGAARITPLALIRPARSIADVEVVAVAARDQTRAQAFARKHGIVAIAKTDEKLTVAVHDPFAPFPADDIKRAVFAELDEVAVPRVIEFVDALPKSDGGKVLKSELV